MGETWEPPKGPDEYVRWHRQRYGEWPTANQVDQETHCGVVSAKYALFSGQRDAAEKWVAEAKDTKGRMPTRGAVVKAVGCDFVIARVALSTVKGALARRSKAGDRYVGRSPRLTR